MAPIPRARTQHKVVVLLQPAPGIQVRDRVLHDGAVRGEGRYHEAQVDEVEFVGVEPGLFGICFEERAIWDVWGGGLDGAEGGGEDVGGGVLRGWGWVRMGGCDGVMGGGTNRVREPRCRSRLLVG